MFKRINNIELLNKIITVENKLDILNTRLDNKTCCDCKSREVIVYEELKDYLQFKLSEFNDQINNKLIEFNNKETLSILNNIFEDYKTQLIDNLQSICNQLNNDKLNNNIIDEKLQQYNNQKNIKEHHCNFSKVDFDSSFNKTQDKLEILCGKLDMLYFENEIIKHQLSLQDEIRKYSDEIDNLSSIIEKTIIEIDEMTKI